MLNSVNIHYGQTDYINVCNYIIKNKQNCLVYMDPPYYNTFNDYSINGFNTDVFIKYLQQIQQQNIPIIISNSLSFVEYYKYKTNTDINYKLIYILNKINNNKDKRQEVLIIINN